MSTNTVSANSLEQRAPASNPSRTFAQPTTQISNPTNEPSGVPVILGTGTKASYIPWSSASALAGKKSPKKPEPFFDYFIYVHNGQTLDYARKIGEKVAQLAHGKIYSETWDPKTGPAIWLAWLTPSEAKQLRSEFTDVSLVAVPRKIEV